MPEPGLVPEDIDYDPSTRKFYLTSVMNHTVLACDDRRGLPRISSVLPNRGR